MRQLSAVGQRLMLSPSCCVERYNVEFLFAEEAPPVRGHSNFNNGLQYFHIAHGCEGAAIAGPEREPWGGITIEPADLNPDIAHQQLELVPCARVMYINAL